MTEIRLDDISLEDLLFLIGGSIFQGSTSNDLDIELLLKLEELLTITIDERLHGIPIDAVIH
tara:strand:- start:87 stop:272 length:186 start_codon:yes stop_codon:yes gene_type:complete